MGLGYGGELQTGSVVFLRARTLDMASGKLGWGTAYKVGAEAIVSFGSFGLGKAIAVGLEPAEGAVLSKSAKLVNFALENGSPGVAERAFGYSQAHDDTVAWQSGPKCLFSCGSGE